MVNCPEGKGREGEGALAANLTSALAGWHTQQTEFNERAHGHEPRHVDFSSLEGRVEDERALELGNPL